MTERKSDLIKVLGLYLVTLAVIEMILSLLHQTPFFLRPRVGFSYLFSDLKVPGKYLVPLAELPSAAWLLALGAAFLRNCRPVKTYVVSEIFLASPTILFLGALAISGGGHILRRVDSILPFIVMVLFTIVPVSLAISALLQNSESTASAPI